ncbi:hypothetical protein [Paenibacillus anseongense]|uniref:hypothetical protein n=1 Tax=Paenibacillus anseongense TaxID=2682845 RepID=UPI00162605B6|nr:hypothetical protein [Paenibacillus anseongense]
MRRPRMNNFNDVKHRWKAAEGRGASERKVQQTSANGQRWPYFAEIRLCKILTDRRAAIHDDSD